MGKDFKNVKSYHGKRTITLNVNDQVHTLKVENRRTLLRVLREDLRLTGVKHACGTGECGACTVLMDGKPILSCLTLAVEAEGRAILTVEGLSKDGKLNPIQEAFIEHHGLQCGFCTTGMIMSAKALLDENPKPSEDEVKEALVGNLCRCGAYPKIIEAVLAAAERMPRGG